MTTKEIKTRADVEKSIASVARRAKTLQEDIHRTAMAIVVLWSNGTAPAKVSADARSECAEWARDALAALSNASPYHGRAFATWMAHFLPMRHEDGAWLLDDVKLSPKIVSAARETPFWELAPAPEAKPFDAIAQARALLDKARKRQQSAKEGDNVPDAFIVALARAIAEHDSANVEH